MFLVSGPLLDTWFFKLIVAKNHNGKVFDALVCMAYWIEHQPLNPKVTGLIASQGTCLGHRPGPLWGCVRGHRSMYLLHVGVSFSFSLKALSRLISLPQSIWNTHQLWNKSLCAFLSPFTFSRSYPNLGSTVWMKPSWAPSVPMETFLSSWSFHCHCSF